MLCKRLQIRSRSRLAAPTSSSDLLRHLVVFSPISSFESELTPPSEERQRYIKKREKTSHRQHAFEEQCSRIPINFVKLRKHPSKFRQDTANFRQASSSRLGGVRELHPEQRDPEQRDAVTQESAPLQSGRSSIPVEYAVKVSMIHPIGPILPSCAVEKIVNGSPSPSQTSSHETSVHSHFYLQDFGI